MFSLDCFVTLEQRGAASVVFDQCCYGPEVVNPLEVLYVGASFEPGRFLVTSMVISQIIGGQKLCRYF